MNIRNCNLFVIVFCITLFSCAVAFAQQDVRNVDMEILNQQKKENKLDGKEQFVNYSRLNNSLKVTPSHPHTLSTSCNCWLDRDATWQIGQFDASGGNGGPGTSPFYRNDDWSTDTVTLPFGFCFYGSPVTKVFINNNGNVSIGAPYSTFTANPFPDSRFVMIAPFWGDVDTRAAGSGLVYYKLTSTYLAVQWDHVGYFDRYDDKVNTFQLIMSDGIDTILPLGQNVSFCYQDMQWTTGDASSGVNGFGGIPATVGVNRGDSTDYIQIGRYDTIGTGYDGPFGNNDGISSLDNQSFYLNVCFSGNNVPPIINALQICDTLTVCEGDTLLLTANYLSPEQNQNTVASLNANGVTGVSLVSSTTGNIANIVVQVIGQPANAGLHTIYISGTDNGTPAQTTNTAIHFLVVPNAIAGFTFTPASPILPGTSVTFTNASTSATSYVWDFGDGSATFTAISPVHLYSLPGIHTVTLTAFNANGCSDIYQVQIIVNSCSPANIISSGSVCQDVPLQISYSGSAGASATFNWNFASGTVVSGSGRGPYMIRWNTPGNYNILLTVNDVGGCVSVATAIPVTVNPSPVAAVSATAVLCTGENDIVTFTGSTLAGAVFTWNFGNATVVTGAGQGPYTLKWNNPGNDLIHLLVTQNGCIDTADFPITINAIPNSLFTVPPSVCSGIPVAITYTGSALSSAGYNWNFNGGTVLSGSGQGPYRVSWNTPGLYTVSLTVTQNGCVSPVTNNPITINANPAAAILSATSFCVGDLDSVRFNGTANAGATYSWNFSNAIIQSGNGPGPYAIHWNVAGSDSIHLTVTQNGCSGVAVFPVLIYQVPTSLFSVPPTVCIKHPVTITYNGSATVTANYTWNFDGGVILSGSGRGPYSVVWNTAGTPNVTLIVTENGCSSILTNHSFIVAGIPPADAGSDQTTCGGGSVQIGTIAQPGLAYQWSPSTGLTDTTSSLTTLVTDNISNTILVRTYIVTSVNIYGCKYQDTVGVSIKPTPVINFSSPAPQCFKGNSFQFSAGGNLLPHTQYNWSFGSWSNPLISNQQNPAAVSYSSPGIFPVSLNAETDGCPAVPVAHPVVVYISPVPDFRPSVYDGCEPLEVRFTNLSSGNGNYYNWNFSDDPDNNNETPVHVFMHSGIYTVALIATTTDGCAEDTFFTNLITVHPVPTAGFESTPSVTPIWEPVIDFDNHSSGAVQYAWDFGDGSGSFIRDPAHTYKDTGTYEVTLFITSQFGCRDTIKGLVRIEFEFTFYIPNAFTPNGDGVNDFFRGYGTYFKTYEMKIFNRWGVIIYSTNDYNKPWDGRVKDVVENDVYVYKIIVTDLKNKVHDYIGHVTLVR